MAQQTPYSHITVEPEDEIVIQAGDASERSQRLRARGQNGDQPRQAEQGASEPLTQAPEPPAPAESAGESQTEREVRELEEDLSSAGKMSSLQKSVIIVLALVVIAVVAYYVVSVQL